MLQEKGVHLIQKNRENKQSIKAFLKDFIFDMAKSSEEIRLSFF